MRPENGVNELIIFGAVKTALMHPNKRGITFMPVKNGNQNL